MKTRRLTVEEFLGFGGRTIRAKRSSLEMGKSEGLQIVAHVAGRGATYHRFVCPAGCGRTPRRVYRRFNRWGCRRCQRLVYTTSQMSGRIERALARLLAVGTPAALSERDLIVLARMDESQVALGSEVVVS